MKHILIRIIFCALPLFSILCASAQNDVYTAKRDSSFQNVIVVKMEVQRAKKEVPVLIEDSLDNSKLVQVAYRQVAENDLMGGVSSVNVEDLMKKNYFTYSLDNMQAYTGGYNGNMWGMDGAMVLVDGVPRDANNVLPTEIQDISFLKSASAVALYGSRAAKGVIYITTKRGKAIGKQISVRANTGIYVPKSYPEYLGSAEYMTLYNEARANDGLAPSFSDETIYNYASGNNPYRYPNVDFFSSDYLRKFYNKSDITAEITGGNDRAKFYTNIGFYYINSLLKFGEAKNNNINRLNVRENIDVKINEWISAKVDANATYYNDRNANGDYWGASAKLRPYRVAPLIPTSYLEANDENSWTMINNSNNVIGGKYFLGGTQLDQTNPFADVYASGDSTYVSRQFQFDASIDMNLERLLKGLSFHTQFAIDYATTYSQVYNNSYAVYEPVWNNYSGVDLISSLNKYNNDKKDGIQYISGSYDKQTISFSGQFDYKPFLGNDHHFSAMIVAAGYQQLESQPNGSPSNVQNLQYYHRTASNVNLGLQADYNYRQKYYANFSGALVHSAKLPDNNRNAISPSLTLGWRISKENFLSGSSVLDDLRLGVSASELNQDIDITGYYLYNAVFQNDNTSGWYSWDDGQGNWLTISRRGANNKLGFIKRKELSASVSASFWKKLLTADISVFKNRMDGLVTQATTIYPSYFNNQGYPSSNFIPYVNFNINDRSGIDFNINLNKEIGPINWTLGFSGIYYKSNIARMDETYADAYQYHTGHPIDGIWGLKSAGFFKDANDIANSPSQSFGQVQPGDIKYVDVNHDGVINSKDSVYLGPAGRYGSPMTFGVHLEVKWNNFTLFALGTGSYGAYGVKNNSYWWVQGDGKYSAVVRDAWTIATANTATYPRLTSLNSDNNFRTSDFWLYSTDRFDLSKVQLTYDFSKQLFKSSRYIHGFSVYINGASLATFAKERKILDMSVGSAPQTRNYNIGVKALF